ncbi:hypothetical protein VTK73DRAFT_4790 [Phialemonium thermophilum]|uniref:Uncharacterized protein n=1 Tax=Phialemonium thermophilum TaxID=223376 RepID=A0ABR3XZW5_9PEZI
MLGFRTRTRQSIAGKTTLTITSASSPRARILPLANSFGLPTVPCALADGTNDGTSSERPAPFLCAWSEGLLGSD